MNEAVRRAQRRRDAARAAQLPEWAEVEEFYPGDWIVIDRRDGEERVLGESATRSGAVDAALARLEREGALTVDWNSGSEETGEE